MDTRQNAFDLSVIIVTWNSASTIAACLTSLRQATEACATQVIVIDNASADATTTIVAANFADATLIRSAENLGFARANNQALHRASAPRILLLNPDVIIHDAGAIAHMLATLDAEPDISLLGPRLIFEDGSHQVGDAGFRPSTPNLICHGLGIAHVLRGISSLYLVRPDRYAGPVVAVDWICGACLMVCRSAIERAGGLDEALFLYAEDVEWGCRMRDLGLHAAYLPHIRVTHLQGRSESQAGAPISTRWLTSLLILYARLNGKRWLPAVRAAFAAGFGARAVVYAALALLRPGQSRFYRARAEVLWEYAKASKHVLF